MEYNKRPIDFPEQLRILKERGMIITNENDALELLGSNDKAKIDSEGAVHYIL